MVEKIRLKELNHFLKQCGIGIGSDEIDATPQFTVHHMHDWDHGYDGFYGLRVYEDGSYDRGTGFSGTRREFYADMQEILSFLFSYFHERNIKKLIIAPCYRYNQFALNAEKNDIFQEIYAFLREYGVRKNERSGIEITVDKHYKQIEMVIEGGFRGISELCLFAPAQKVLLAPSHHFGITFFTQNKSKETETVLSLLENYPNLKYFDFS